MSADVVAGLLWGALAGVVLGVVFFLGLWATVTRVSRRQVAAAWLAASFVVRLALMGGGLYLVARGGLWHLLGALVGILLARPLVTRLVVARRGEERPGR